MARKGHSTVRRSQGGCLLGCLGRFLALLGLCAFLFVLACSIGIISTDEQTGAPVYSFDNVHVPEISDFNPSNMPWPDVGGISALWPYPMQSEGLTIKTLQAGKGEALLICSDGYTMLVNGGSGMGFSLAAQMLLCGANHLDVMVVTGTEEEYIHACPRILSMTQPTYLLYQNSQVKSDSFNKLLDIADKNESIQALVPSPGLSFHLGRAEITFLGPTWKPHQDEKDDGLTFRIDYGDTSVLIAGTITKNGEAEIAKGKGNIAADVLVCARGGEETGTCREWVQKVRPKMAVLTGKNPSNSTRIRLSQEGAEVFAMKDHGVITIRSDGNRIEVVP